VPDHSPSRVPASPDALLFAGGAGLDVDTRGGVSYEAANKRSDYDAHCEADCWNRGSPSEPDNL
jgi:hypothetical protein